MSQHTPQGNFISNTARGAVGLVHGVADQILPPAVDSVFHGVARGLLDWAGAPTQRCSNHSPTSPPCQPHSVSPSFRGKPCRDKNSGNIIDGNDNVQSSGNGNSGSSNWTIGKK